MEKEVNCQIEIQHRFSPEIEEIISKVILAFLVVKLF